MTVTRRTFISVVLALAVGVGLNLALIGLGPLGDQGPWQVRILTATKGGTYYTLGQQFARILSRLGEVERAVSESTAGSGENLQRLLHSQAKADSGWDEIAFVFKPVLADLSMEERGQVRILSRLYTQEVQIAVRKGAGIQRLADLDGKSVYVGRVGSGTKFIAEKILSAVGITPAIRVEEPSYLEAARMLGAGELDAAIFSAGKRSPAVTTALESGSCALLDLSDNASELVREIPVLSIQNIPANFYKNQPAELTTVGTDAYLMSSNTLSNELAFLVLNALFDNVGNLLIKHIMARDIRIEKAFSGLPKNIELHPAAERFKQREAKALLIATGVYGGKYYETGRKIQMLLKEYGIHARVAHTGGSLENTRILTERPALAIIQHDIALAASWGDPDIVYGDGVIPQDVGIIAVKNVQRIAALHTEKVHIMARRDLFSQRSDPRRLIHELNDARICLGAPHSGSQVLATAIFAHHGITPKNPTLMAVPDMVVSILSGAIDVGVFVSYVPSSAARTLLENDEIRLLSVIPKELTELTGSALRLSKIEPDTYRSQSEDEPAVETLETTAMLVTTADLPFDVREITEAVFKGADYLGLDPTKMRQEITSIPLHKGAEEYYRETFLPPPPSSNLLRQFWYIMASLAILAAAARGQREYRQKKEADRVREKIYAVSLEADETEAVFKLLNVKSGIRRGIEKSWRGRGPLDQVRQQNLRRLIDERIEITQKICTRAIIVDLNNISRTESLNPDSRDKQYAAIEERTWRELENYKLTEAQHAFLLGVIQHRQNSPSG